MRTTVNVPSELVEAIDKTIEKLSFNNRGEGISFLLKNALNHIKIKGYDSFLMQTPEAKNLRKRIIKQMKTSLSDDKSAS